MSTSGREESREVAEGDSDFEYAYEALQLELMQLRRCAVSLGLVRVVEDLHAHHDRLVHTLVTAVRKDERERASEDLNATIHDILNQFTSFSREDAPTAYERDRSMYSFPIKRRDYLLGWEGAVYREHIREKLATPAEGGTE